MRFLRVQELKILSKVHSVTYPLRDAKGEKLRNLVILNLVLFDI